MVWIKYFGFTLARQKWQLAGKRAEIQRTTFWLQDDYLPHLLTLKMFHILLKRLKFWTWVGGLRLMQLCRQDNCTNMITEFWYLFPLFRTEVSKIRSETSLSNLRKGSNCLLFKLLEQPSQLGELSPISLHFTISRLFRHQEFCCVIVIYDWSSNSVFVLILINLTNKVRREKTKSFLILFVSDLCWVFTQLFVLLTT